MARKKAVEVEAQGVEKEPGFISNPDGFINVPVSKVTRKTLFELKQAMGVKSQAEVVERAVAIVKAITTAARQ